MKRKLTLLVCVIVVVAMMFAMASCGNKGDDNANHTHTFSEEWTTTDTAHWHAATCGCTGVKSSYSEHTDADDDAKCDICGYCDHNFGSEWLSDEKNHWNAATCTDHADYKGNLAEHVDSNNDAKCDVCNYCSHSYSNEWSSDATNHWYAPTCGCDVKKDLATHADADKDGACDTCGYVMCTHEFKDTWSSDENGHWYAAKCGCNVKKEEAAHTDADNDGICDICEYVICDHDFQEAWTSDEANHWHAAGCKDHADLKIDVAPHTDADGDKKCDTCGVDYCGNHTFEEKLSHDENGHWYAATCGCNVKKGEAAHDFASEYSTDGTNHWLDTTCGCPYKKDEGAHNDADGNYLCDKCSYFMSTVAEIIGKVDAEAVAKMNSAFVDYYKKVVAGMGVAETDVIAGVEYYDNYAVYTTIDGDTFYCSYYGEAEALFVVRVDAEGNVIREENVTEYPTGTTFTFNDLITASTYEAYVTGLYNLTGKIGLTEGANAETGRVCFSFAYTDENAYVVYVEFELDKETNGIKSAKVTIDGYSMSDVTIDTENNTYVVAEEAKKVQECVFEITQTFGDAMDSAEKPNPYSADNSVITDDFSVVTKDEEGNVTGTYGEEDTIKVIVGETIVLYFDAETAELAKLSNVTISDDGNSEAIYCYIPFGTKTFKVLAKEAGTYTFTITAEDVVLNLNIEIEAKEPTSLKGGVEENGNLKSTDSTNVYVDNDVVIGAIVGEDEDASTTATVVEGNADNVTLTQDGYNWTFNASVAGTYVIELVSTKNAELKDTITIVVEELPTIAELLNGKFTGKTLGYRINIEAIFTSIDETTGTVVVTLDGSYSIKVDGENQTVSANGTATYSYVYNTETGMLALTKTEGDDIILEYIKVDNLEVVAGIKNDLACPLEKETTGSGEQGDATTGPITVIMTGAHTYCYEYEFEFVAGEAGEYTFTVPVGFGVISAEALENWGNPYVDFQMDNGGTFTLELSAGETVLLYFGSKETGTYEITFTYSAAQGGDNEPDGDGTVENPFVITEGGNYTATVIDAGYVYYIYQATATGDVVITFTGDNYWLEYGTYSFDMCDVSEAASTTISVTQGQTLYIKVSTYEDSDEVPFTVTLPGGATPPQTAGDGSVENPFVITEGGSYSATVVDAGYVYYIYQATATGDVVITFTGDNHWLEYSTLGFNFCDTTEATSTTISVMQGNTLYIKVSTYEGSAEVPFTVTLPGEGTTQDPIENELVLGSNSVTISAEDAEMGGKEYTFTTTVAGQYTFASNDVGVRIFDENGTMIGMGSVALEANKTYKAVVLAMSEGTYTINISVVEEEQGGTQGGTEDDPIVWDEIPSEVTINSDTYNKIYYTFTATESGYISITYPSADSWADMFEIVNGAIDGSNSQSSSEQTVANFAIEAGKTYRLGIGTWSNAGEFTLTISVGDSEIGGGDVGGGDDPQEPAEPDGSLDNPYPVENGDYVANFPAGWEAVYHVYEATQNGYVTITTTYEGQPWLEIGTDAFYLTNNIIGYDPETESNIYAYTMKVYALAGQKVYIGVGDYSFEAAEVPFTVSFEAFESEPIDSIVGTWESKQDQGWAVFNFTIVINADGTGTVIDDYGYSKDEYTITFILVDGNAVTVYASNEYTSVKYNLTYDAEAGTLYNAEQDITYSPAVEDSLVIGDNTIEVTGDNTQMTEVTITATANGTLIFTAGEEAVIEYNGGATLENETLEVEVEAGDVITIAVNHMYGEAGTVVISVGFEEPTGDEEETGNELVLGSNSVTISAQDAEMGGKEYTFTAIVTGQYTFASNDVGVRIFDENGTMIGMGSVALEANKTYKAFVLAMGEGTYTINITAVEQSGGGDEGGEGEETVGGTEAEPMVLDTLPESITFNSNTSDKVYYLFTATESGTLTFTWPTADSWYDIFEMDGTNTTGNSTSGYSTESFSFEIEAGKTYRFSLGTWMTPGEVTVTISFAA